MGTRTLSPIPKNRQAPSLARARLAPRRLSARQRRHRQTLRRMVTVMRKHAMRLGDCERAWAMFAAASRIEGRLLNDELDFGA